MLIKLCDYNGHYLKEKKVQIASVAADCGLVALCKETSHYGSNTALSDLEPEKAAVSLAVNISTPKLRIRYFFLFLLGIIRKIFINMFSPLILSSHKFTIHV